MKRLLCVLIAVLGSASAAHAATISVFFGHGSDTYLPGEEVAIFVEYSAGGEIADSVYGQFEYDALILLGPSFSVQYEIISEDFRVWTPLPTPCGGGVCVAFNQEHPPLAPEEELFPVAPGETLNLAQIFFTAGAPGSTTLTWTTGDPSDPLALDFLGLTNAPGLTVIVVPEPATAALLALGLVVLGAARRTRS